MQTSPSKDSSKQVAVLVPLQLNPKIGTFDTFEGEVFCDWMSFRHDFEPDNQQLPIESGKTLKIDKNGQK